MENTNEMYLRSKYKYLIKSFTNNLNRGASVLTPAEEKKRLKELKKKEMEKACKPGEKALKKTQFKGNSTQEEVKSETPYGQKKDMSKPMADSYNSKAVEDSWDAWWNNQKFFETDLNKAMSAPREKRFIMVLPPPNVTGSLHLGHTLMGAIEDAITRWKRMKGFQVLWVPGTDHAGIATQSVVEKKLKKEENKTRHDLGREEFLKRVWHWKEEYGNTILNQFRRLGVSFDWSKMYFTLDDERSKAVVEAFVQLHDRGILYRAERIVHWCCTLRTAISDIEVEELQLTGPTKLKVPLHDGEYEFGVLIDFAYKLKEDPSQEIVVSTTRIETMLGDVAVAVHPDDKRYQHLIGKELIHPFVKDRKMKVIADGVLVDMKFGTGAVKITPAHDPNDFLCGQRHNLEIVHMFNDDGIINENGGMFKGLRRYECRKNILVELEKLKLLRGKRDNPMVLSICSKTGDIIEPLVKPQWWVNCKDVAKRTIDDVNSGKLKILPESYKTQLFEFLNNIRDWCVSRQLWWGHRCPAYLVTIKGKLENPQIQNNNHYVAAASYEEALEKAAKKFGANKADITLVQDEDVLDTWFSSALLPFSVFGWPDLSSKELKTYFPTDLLETGHDILFFWVARMVFMSYFFMDTIPYHTVFLHPIVRDSQGRKMSKSLGNVIDPLEVIDGISLDGLIEKIKAGNLPPSEVQKSIAEKKKEFPQGIPDCGADALRFGLLAYMVQGRNINLNILNIVSYRFFCNKLWNATKFTLMNLEGFVYAKDIKSLKLSLMDKWILSKLSTAISVVDEKMEKYSFGEAVNQIYSFWLDNFCDVYVESMKPIMRSKDEEARKAVQNVLYYCMDRGMRLMHPFMPFLTEELYQRLPHPEGNRWESVCIAEFPIETFWQNSEIEGKVEKLLEISHSILSVLSQFKIDKSKPKVCVFGEKATVDLVNEEKLVLQTLGKTGEIFTTSTKNDQSYKKWLKNFVNASTDVLLDIKDLIDIKKEIERIQKIMKERNEYKSELVAKINSPQYEEKVKEDIKKINAKKLADVSLEIEKLDEALQVLVNINN